MQKKKTKVYKKIQKIVKDTGLNRINIFENAFSQNKFSYFCFIYLILFLGKN